MNKGRDILTSEPQIRIPRFFWTVEGFTEFKFQVTIGLDKIDFDR
jgi:hypothetical protein